MGLCHYIRRKSNIFWIKKFIQHTNILKVKDLILTHIERYTQADKFNIF